MQVFKARISFCVLDFDGGAFVSRFGRFFIQIGKLNRRRIRRLTRSFEMRRRRVEFVQLTGALVFNAIGFTLDFGD